MCVSACVSVVVIYLLPGLRPNRGEVTVLSLYFLKNYVAMKQRHFLKMILTFLELFPFESFEKFLFQ